MDAAVAEIINNRVKPIVDEVFDGYVIMGYHTDSNGVRQRIILHNTGERHKVQVVEGMPIMDVGPKDSALYDAMMKLVAGARQWRGEQ